MLDLTKIKDISMTYIMKNDGESYAYTQAKDSLVVSSDEQTIRVTLKSEKNRENIEPFDIVVIQKDNRCWIKSDFFEDISVLSPVSTYEGDDSFILVHQIEDEMMYLHLYCD